MDYKQIIISTLDSFGVNRSYTGYNYVVHGLLLIIEDNERLDCITKYLYLDIAKHFHTSWGCVEKNMRTVINCIWNSSNEGLLELIFNKSSQDKRPTNKHFLKCMYDYVIQFNRNIQTEGAVVPIICPVSGRYCDSLSTFYARIALVVNRKQ